MTSKTAGKLAKRAGEEPGEKLTWEERLERQKPEIQKALPTSVSAERFARVALTTVKGNRDLMRCTPQSLLGALMVASQTGLEPGPIGLSYIVPRRVKVTADDGSDRWEMQAQWQIGYKGIVALARRSGEINDIHARAVREGDEFEFEYGLNDKLIHRPVLDDPGEIVAFYGLAKYRSGGHYFRVMSREQVEERRQRSSAPDSPAWKNDYEAMGCKTVLRSMAPWLPLEQEEASAIAHDEQVHVDLSPNMTESPAPEPDGPEGVIDVEPADEGEDEPGAGEMALDELHATAQTDEQKGTALAAAQLAAREAGVAAPKKFEEIGPELAEAARAAL